MEDEGYGAGSRNTRVEMDGGSGRTWMPMMWSMWWRWMFMSVRRGVELSDNGGEGCVYDGVEVWEKGEKGCCGGMSEVFGLETEFWRREMSGRRVLLLLLWLCLVALRGNGRCGGVPGGIGSGSCHSSCWSLSEGCSTIIKKSTMIFFIFPDI